MTLDLNNNPRLGMGCWAIGGPFWAGDAPLGWGDVDDAESMPRRSVEHLAVAPDGTLWAAGSAYSDVDDVEFGGTIDEWIDLDEFQRACKLALELATMR